MDLKKEKLDLLLEKLERLAKDVIEKKRLSDYDHENNEKQISYNDIEGMLCFVLETFLTSLRNSEEKIDRRKEVLVNQCEQLIQIQEERLRNKRTLDVLDDEIRKTKKMIGLLTQMKQTEMERRVKIAEPILYSEYISISTTQKAKEFLSGLQDRQRSLDDLRKLAVWRLCRLSKESKIPTKRKEKAPAKSNGSGGTSPKKTGRMGSKRTLDLPQGPADDDVTVQTRIQPMELDVPLSLDIFEPRPPAPLMTLANNLRNIGQSPTLFFRDSLAEAMVNGLSSMDIDTASSRSSLVSARSNSRATASFSSFRSLDNIDLDLDGSSSQTPGQAEISISSLSFFDDVGGSMPESDI